MSLDPISGEFPELTPYQFASNTTIQAIDLDGAEPLPITFRWFMGQESFKPELILLDIMMPHKDGIQTCIEIRANPLYDDTLIIFLTALSDEKSEIRGLEIGADDYIAKPIKPKLLVSRVHSAFRRINREDNHVMIFPNLEINREKFMVRHQGQEVALPRKEFELFALLASKPGRVFLRNEILEKVWGNDVIVGDRTIDVHVRKIRQKLNADYIHTVKGVGYKFEA